MIDTEKQRKNRSDRWRQCNIVEHNLHDLTTSDYKNDSNAIIKQRFNEIVLELRKLKELYKQKFKNDKEPRKD